MLKTQLSIKEIYDSYIQKLNKQKSIIRYSDRTWFHSSSGFMYEKTFLLLGGRAKGKLSKMIRCDSSVLVIQSTKIYKMQLGITDVTLPILIEKELYLDDFNVRGFIDLKLLLDRNTLYDIKTCVMEVVRCLVEVAMVCQTYISGLQLATYGIWVREEYDIQDLKLVMVYYNKNTSFIREVELMSDEMMAEGTVVLGKSKRLIRTYTLGGSIDLDERGIDMDNHFVTDIPSMDKQFFKYHLLN